MWNLFEKRYCLFCQKFWMFVSCRKTSWDEYKSEIAKGNNIGLHFSVHTADLFQNSKRLCIIMYIRRHRNLVVFQRKLKMPSVTDIKYGWIYWICISYLRLMFYYYMYVEGAIKNFWGFEAALFINISSVVEFQRWWALKSKIFAMWWPGSRISFDFLKWRSTGPQKLTKMSF